jgi:predicted dehydrogenase
MHDMERSGGPIFDYSIHFIEFARACMGVEALTALYAGAAPTGRVKSDDHAVLAIGFEGGGFGEFTKSWALPPGCGFRWERTCVVCRDGCIEIAGGEATIHATGAARPLQPSPASLPGRANALAEFLDAIENDGRAYTTELEGLRTIEILDAALRSRESGRREGVVVHGE